MMYIDCDLLSNSFTSSQQESVVSNALIIERNIIPDKQIVSTIKYSHTQRRKCKFQVNDSKTACIKKFDQTTVTKVTKEISLLVFTKKPQYVVKIINIYDSQEYCLEMEYGQSDLLKTYQQCNIFQKLAIMHQMTLAVKEVHDLTIIHRDVKLENFIQFKRNNRIIYKLTDFGISQFLETPKDSCGTYYIMAPEQLSEYPTYAQSVDNWALGSNFYTMVTMKQLLNSSSKEDAKDYLKAMKIKDIEEVLKAQNPELLVQIICGLLKKDPKERMNLNVVLGLLEQIIAQNPRQPSLFFRLYIFQGKVQYQSYQCLELKNNNNSELICYYPQTVEMNEKIVTTLPNELKIKSIDIWNCVEQTSASIKIYQFLIVMIKNNKKEISFDHLKRTYLKFYTFEDFPKMEIHLNLKSDLYFVDLNCDLFSNNSTFSQSESVVSQTDFDALIMERNQLYQAELTKVPGYEHIFLKSIQKKQTFYTYCLNFEEPIKDISTLIKCKTYVRSPYDIQYIIPKEYNLEVIDYNNINDFLRITYILIFTSQQLSLFNLQFHTLSNNIVKYKLSIPTELNKPNNSVFECLPTNIVIIQDLKLKEEEIIRQIFLYMLEQVENRDLKEFFKKTDSDFWKFYERGMSGELNFKALEEFKQVLDNSQQLSEPENQLRTNKPIIEIDSLLAEENIKVQNYLQQVVFPKIQEQQKFKRVILLYRSSRDGLIYERIKEQCFKKGRFLMLIKPFEGVTQQIIGGYSPLELQAKNKRQSDPNLHTFIFSLTRGEIYPLRKEAQDQAIISSYSDANKFYYFHLGDFDVFLTIPSKEISDQQFPNFKTEFPRSFDTDAYPDVPPSHDDEKDQYLIMAPNGQNLLRGKAKILELEIFGFEEL